MFHDNTRYSLIPFACCQTGSFTPQLPCEPPLPASLLVEESIFLFHPPIPPEALLLACSFSLRTVVKINRRSRLSLPNGPSPRLFPTTIAGFSVKRFFPYKTANTCFRMHSGRSAPSQVRTILNPPPIPLSCDSELDLTRGFL